MSAVNEKPDVIKKELKGDSICALFLVSLSVLLASSTWFSGTAAAPVLKRIWNLSEVQSSWLTVSVQLGFISGTFLYALLNIADIFKTRKVFFFSALLSAAFNAGFALFSSGLGSALIFRFLTGVTLAGVYPVGMKIIAQWFRSSLGWRLSIMVGALTLGTAFPYLFFAIGADFNWQHLMTVASLLAVSGGLIILLGVSDGPFLQESPVFNVKAAFRIFRYQKFRYQAFGYFGHMWELYAFWSLVSWYLSSSFAQRASHFSRLLPLISFLAISVGVIGCIGGGWVSKWTGERRVALFSLIISGVLCALSGFLFNLQPVVLVIVIILWGIFVISDSPQFSALAAQYSPPEYTGTALTIQNGLGFGITVISIQFIAWLSQYIGWQWAFVFLSGGPLFGAFSMMKLHGDNSQFR